jgi:quinoprotein glucose dehydrogenase
MSGRSRLCVLCLCALFPTLLAVAGPRAGPGADWPCTGGDPGCARYSPLAQISRRNVRDLQVAWAYHTGDQDDARKTTIECTPVVVDGVMYVTSVRSRVIALDAATGLEIWNYDPYAGGGRRIIASGGVNRGVAYWSDGAPGGARRILAGIADGRLISLDARTGRPDPGFGDGGVVELRAGMERDLARLPYGPTSAPAIFKDLVILGVSCGEGPEPAAPGDVRAFDVRTGREAWRFHTVPRPGEFGHETWEGDSWKDRGGANAWGGASVDVERGMVFVGLGSASFDFYGGDRKGQNLFANCTVALDARTGKRRWHFQTLRHDLWDHDLPVYPNLVTVRRQAKRIDAVAQVTKTAVVFVFDRETGRPLFPVEERPVPSSDVPGEQAWPTQVFPVRPPPFSRQRFDEEDATDISKEAHDYVLAKLKTLRHGSIFTPPSLQGTVTIPGFHGGATWSGASFDPTTGLLYVNSNNVPNVTTLVKAPPGKGYEYTHTGYYRFLDQEGYPAVKPPWGNLTAIDLNRGEFAWRITLGEFPELTARGIPPTGTENFGGTIVTAGGLVFIGGTKDEKFHAFDKTTGKLLWEYRLPAGGYATPCTYSVSGRQYVAIAAGGGGKLGTKSGDAFMAFALPGAGK